MTMLMTMTTVLIFTMMGTGHTFLLLLNYLLLLSYAAEAMYKTRHPFEEFLQGYNVLIEYQEMLGLMKANVG